jgi:hypothetical protein
MLLHLNVLIVALYVGPDQLMPLTSILGAVGGAILIFWRQLVAFAKRIARVFARDK